MGCQPSMHRAKQSFRSKRPMVSAVTCPVQLLATRSEPGCKCAERRRNSGDSTQEFSCRWDPFGIKSAKFDCANSQCVVTCGKDKVPLMEARGLTRFREGHIYRIRLRVENAIVENADVENAASRVIVGVGNTSATSHKLAARTVFSSLRPTETFVLELDLKENAAGGGGGKSSGSGCLYVARVCNLPPNCGPEEKEREIDEFSAIEKHVIPEDIALPLRLYVRVRYPESTRLYIDQEEEVCSPMTAHTASLV